mmetsp:Transcript_11586/g.10094  ORF Transcript_11586/g.10094 Transcript_11586/m.10094 type:complete len:334 (-) Transcript_11586:551-1552(-)
MNLLRSKITVPHHHPDFLLELLILEKTELAEYIMTSMIEKIRNDEPLSGKFNISIQKITEILNISQSELANIDDTEVPPDRDEGASRQLKSLKSIIADNIDDKDYKELAQKIRNEDITQLTGAENFLLATMIETMITNKENSRSLDAYAAVFNYYLKIFKLSQMHVGGMTKMKALSTKEIVWVLHSAQKDTIVQESVEREGLDRIKWENLRKLGVPIWYDNLDKIKSYIEKFAMQIFRKTRDPFDVVFWYIILNKKNILTTLFKQSNKNDAKSRNVADFMLRDFRDPKNCSAANKNAFVLLSQKKLEMSAAFFLMGGYLAEAVDVLANSMEDI